MNVKTIVSECVTNGHPDKIADRIADSILNEYNKVDENVRAGIEVMVKDNIAVLGGEINSNATIDYDRVVRNVYRQLDFTPEHDLEPDKIKIINLIGKQSPEIHYGVDQGSVIGAGDQGFVCGYANNETPAYIGLGQYVAKMICLFVERADYLGPDAKSQVVVDYVDGIPRIDSILVSTMHYGFLNSLESVRENVRIAIKSNLINLDSDIYTKYIKANKFVKIVVNPCGAWHTGGPVSDCGVTGRKIVVDHYGGYCNVGGGSLTGKDMTKVDRSGSYMARFLAKNIVASGIADEAKVEISYMIGVPDPSSVFVELNRNKDQEQRITDIIKDRIDLTPMGIINRFGYADGMYDAIGTYGHYGIPHMVPKINQAFYPWEDTGIRIMFI